jgi:protein-S-isoprenylcysteine O-methyltransferase Ste14
MIISFAFFPTLVFGIVMICWLTFAGIFLFRKKPVSAPAKVRDRGSIIGVVLQGLAYGIVWGVHRKPFTPFLASSRLMTVAAGLMAILVAVGSVMLIMAAVNTLGKEWSVTARLVEGHKLATSGVYAYLRHPIYTGMLGMLLATGVAYGTWVALVAALVIFFIGTMIRVRSEERLLREAFGQNFDDYAQRVSAIVPGLY